ncbi:MAG TPA: PDZ domain-containing protein [Streptosporangiaceae bacterium]
MSRRTVTLLVAGIGVVAAALAAALLPVPYVILSPGPTLNTLGRTSSGPLISISGHPTYPTNGHLNLVTVSFLGGPGDSFNVFTALRAWLTPHEAVVPEQELFPSGQSEQQVERQDTLQMVSSQETAEAAALCALNIHFTTLDTVTQTEKGLPAAGVLKPGDQIIGVDGTPVGCSHDSGTLIRQHPPGSQVTLTVLRKGQPQHITLKTANVQGHSVIGVFLTENFRFPFKINIKVGNIGGPSAGMMFALGIVDKLTPGSLTGGKFVAGTGEISANGAVSPIGGIQQKMAGARAAGATWFLTPAANCADTSRAVPAGLHLAKVATLHQALTDLAAIKAGRSVPGC